MYLVSFELIFMLSSSKIMAYFDVKVNMLLILGECEKNYRRTAQLFLECYNIKKLQIWHFFVCVYDQLSAIKRQKINPVVNYDNSTFSQQLK